MANIQKELDDFKNAVYGEDVRNGLISSVTAINNEVISNTVTTNNTKTRQDTLEKKFNDQIKNMSLANPSMAEVVDARISDTGAAYATLGARLSAERVDGGTNLLKATALKKNMDYIAKWSISGAVWHVTDDVVFGQTPHGNRSFRGDCNDTTSYYGVHNSVYLRENTTYTMSCWILFDSDCEDTEGVVIQMSCQDKSDKYYYNIKPLRAKDVIKGKWTFLSHTFTTKDLKNNKLSDFCIQPDLRKFHGYVGDFKLEIGSHATDWCPNPQDYVLWSNPIGYTIMNDGTDPSTTIGGIWEHALPGMTPIGVGEHTDTRGEKRTFTNGQTGGEYRHVQSDGELAKHNHEEQVGSDNGGPCHGPADFSKDYERGLSAYPQGISTIETGNSDPMNIMTPFFALYFWKRTA